MGIITLKSFRGIILARMTYVLLIKASRVTYIRIRYLEISSTSAYTIRIRLQNGENFIPRFAR
jgi:hypothetical protein